MTTPRAVPGRGSRAVAVLGGALFLGSMVYAGYAYVVRFDAAAAPWTSRESLGAAGVDGLLFTLFALHHSLLVRAGLKARITARVGPYLERPTYVIVASLLFIGVTAFWQPVGGVLWSTTGGAAMALAAVQIAGVVLTGQAAARIGFLELAGVRRAAGLAGGGPFELATDGLYRLVRHPIYFAWLLMVWPAPVMTGTRFVFAALSTLYLVLAIPFEERDLDKAAGPAWAQYTRRVRWRLVPFVY